MTSLENRKGERRTKNWWEPIYDPVVEQNIAKFQWSDITSESLKYKFIFADRLLYEVEDRNIKEIRNVVFEGCDFQGYFLRETTLLFIRCHFVNCDFGSSTWNTFTFSGCSFERSSFSMTTFERCAFEDCKWTTMALNGSRTIFVRTIISNPIQFLAAGFSGTSDRAQRRHQHVLYQRYRLERTRAHVARTIMASQQEVGDEDHFYEAAQSHDIQKIRERIWKTIHDDVGTLYDIIERYPDRDVRTALRLSVRAVTKIPSVPKIALYLTELTMLKVMGLVNNWGADPLRPLAYLLMSVLTFAAAYHMTYPEFSALPFQKSFEIASLAGFTNQSNSQQPLGLRTMQNVQLTFSAFCYTVFFATVGSRLSRSR